LWLGCWRRIWKSGTSTGCQSASDAGNLAIRNSLNISTRVCQLPFRYVIKYENLAEEWPHLLYSLGVSEDERTALELPWENKGSGEAGSLKAGYMDKLPEEILLKLFNKVAADFTMFGYTIEDQY